MNPCNNGRVITISTRLQRSYYVQDLHYGKWPGVAHVIWFATVSLTDSQEVTRTATTSSFGFYSFDNILTGGPYSGQDIVKTLSLCPAESAGQWQQDLPDFVGLE